LPESEAAWRGLRDRAEALGVGARLATLGAFR